jgi:hypothetical protein
MSNKLTIRDHFAAAALTGLLGGRPEPYTDEYAGAFAKAAWLLADAMLAARGTTDHDAAPAAKASGRDSSAEAGTGDTRASQEPVAWGVYCGNEIDIACLSREGAAAWVRDWPDRRYRIVRLYAAPPAGSVTLTDEEIAFLELHCQRLVWWAHFPRSSDDSKRELVTIRGLLARAAKEVR